MPSSPVRKLKKNLNNQAPPHYHVNKQILASLGGGWENTPPFSGDEDKLYRWMAEPARPASGCGATRAPSSPSESRPPSPSRSPPPPSR